MLSEIISSMGLFASLLLRLTVEIFDLTPDVLFNPREYVVFPSSVRLVALLKYPHISNLNSEERS